MGGCSGTSQHCRSSHGHHCCGETTDCFQPYLEEGAAKISPEFSGDPAVCIWEPTAGRGQLPAEAAQPQHQERGSRCIHLLCGRSSLFPLPSGAGGGCYWVEVCATSLVRQSKSLEQLSAALGQLCSRQRKPPCEMGLALHPCTSIHAVLGEFLKMLSQPPVM